MAKLGHILVRQRTAAGNSNLTTLPRDGKTGAQHSEASYR